MLFRSVSSHDTTPEPEPEPKKQISKNKFKSQRNKKSAIKVSENKEVVNHNIPTNKNYFCD